MTNTHSYSFFGQNTGLLLNSSSNSEPFFFFRCIKRKPDGIWEKPSKGEGKVIKFSLEEAVMILEVLNRRMINWSTYHTYKDNKTPISLGWEDEKARTLWVNIGNYSKMLNFAQSGVLKMLLTHLLAEKIEFATSSNNENISGKKATNTNYNSNTSNNDANDELVEFQENFNEETFEEKNSEFFNDSEKKKPKSKKKDEFLKEMSNIEGIIKGETEKALLIEFSGHEFWVPKSTIHCQYTPKKDMVQNFLIDKWILKRNKIIA